MNIGILTGVKGLPIEDWAEKKKISPAFASALLKCIEDAEEVPYLLDGLMKGFSKLGKPQKKEIRNALIRIQMYCSLHDNPDPIKHSRLFFISQMLERLFFGCNILISGEIEEEEAEK
jgi:hypothetical protein